MSTESWSLREQAFENEIGLVIVYHFHDVWRKERQLHAADLRQVCPVGEMQVPGYVPVGVDRIEGRATGRAGTTLFRHLPGGHLRGERVFNHGCGLAGRLFLLLLMARMFFVRVFYAVQDVALLFRHEQAFVGGSFRRLVCSCFLRNRRGGGVVRRPLVCCAFEDKRRNLEARRGHPALPGRTVTGFVLGGGSFAVKARGLGWAGLVEAGAWPAVEQVVGSIRGGCFGRRPIGRKRNAVRRERSPHWNTTDWLSVVGLRSDLLRGIAVHPRGVFRQAQL